MDTNLLLLNTLLATILGALIGLKNEYDKTGRKIVGGFRTFSLLAISGVISGVFVLNDLLLLSALLSGTITAFIVSYYINGMVSQKAVGITEELSAIFAHFIGLLLILDAFPVKFVVALTVLVVFIITRRNEIRALNKNIPKEEVVEFLLFAIIALVILPFLPNISYSIQSLHLFDPTIIESSGFIQKLSTIELINPFKTWLFVVLVSGIDLFAYICSKTISKENGTFVSASIAGLVSSTSTTIALAIDSKKTQAKDKIELLTAAALSSNAVSFIQAMLLIAPLSFKLFKITLAPSLILMSGCFFAAFFLKAKASHDHKLIEAQEPQQEHFIFRLGPALKFALLVTIVKLVSQIALKFIGNSGFVASSLLASLTGMDAVLISLADTTNGSTITLYLAYMTFMAANFVNLATKSIYSFTSGSKEFAKSFTLYVSVVFVIAFAFGLLLI